MRISLICNCELFLTVDLTVDTLVISGAHGLIRRVRQVSLEPVTTDCQGFATILGDSVSTGAKWSTPAVVTGQGDRRFSIVVTTGFIWFENFSVDTGERYSSNTHSPFFTLFLILRLTLATLLRTGSGGTIHPKF